MSTHGYATAEATREKLIVAAERLFAQGGIDGVSLNDVRLAAGQKNASAVRYHFGTKAHLIHAVLDRRLEPINAARWEMLNAMHEADRSNPRLLVEVLVRPLVESLRTSAYFVAFLSRLVEKDVAGGLYRSGVVDNTSSGRAIDHLLSEAISFLPDTFAGLRLRMLYRSVLHTLSDVEPGQGGLHDVQLAYFIGAWEGLLMAQPSD